MSSSESQDETHLTPSALGTKAHWDSLYALELTNHSSNPSDIGTVWFSDSDCESRIYQYLTSDDLSLSSTTTFLDVGTGNGHLLFSLLEDGDFEGDGMVGVDYSEGSVELAKNIAEQTPNAEGVKFFQLDIIKSSTELDFFGSRIAEEGGFDVILDKGTFDAISLSDEMLDDGSGRRIYEVYPEKVAKWLKPEGGIMLITSCNWTEDELVKKMTTSNSGLEKMGRVKYPEFTFGGKKGSTVCTVAFRLPAKGMIPTQI
ncbi:hypothetical protein TWF225_008546 [Orbilia oligospora]|uniref:Protein-lysine N-methyltransferase EFM4 n=1 Tax=Orbilia oligospora TaxID=2813651 RepID=A0A7C8PVF2_ORBOL|nr:hypothetical protein TWF225_008546 [Orbilia oligospora]KAF3180971.1 hypothetical protein TWF751_010184 [Orbilia oligospora]KAF3254337.1 hypothetical protein TWF128_006143 [Orbilia oligospora]KAF3255488.1 hypothetical protein TWF217_006654 [Orbilia oligospora]KAF3295796.1 hypothetical protein TWF132_001111 [Orbilia oligospora]